MYKVTLFDRNCPSCCSWTTEFYCDNIDEFERKWLKEETDENRVERFRGSKNGECVTDYYSDDPALDIVQYDGAAEVYCEQECSYADRELILNNGYRWPATYYAKNIRIMLRYVKFRGVYMEQAAYRLEGICMVSTFDDMRYVPATCWGNKVLEHHKTFSASSDDKASFAQDVIESFVYFPVRRFETKEDMEQAYRERSERGMQDKELDMLMCDIPGEAG